MNQILLRLFIYLLVCIPTVLSAAEYGDFTYEIVDGTTVTITAYSTNGPLDVDIPAEIEDLPVASIGDAVFSVSGSYPSTSITSINIPDSVTSIGDYVFYRCKDLTTISIPNSVTSIGDGAFYRTGLTNIEIPTSVTSIGNNSIGGISSLTSITVAPGNPAYSSIDGILFDLTQTSLIQFPAGKTGTYSIPSSVISIVDYAFQSCDALTSIHIPSSVTSIGSSAFRHCTGLADISIPSSVASIGSGAFDFCSNLMNITVAQGNLTYSSMDGVLFNLSQSILLRYPAGKTGVYSIPNSVTRIGDYAFQFCDAFTSLRIPASVTSIGSNAFESCGGLTSVHIAEGVLSIGTSAFRFCDDLTSINIPGSVTSIGSNAFESCYDLTSVNIAEGVLSIGDYAFRSCDDLTSINIPGSVTSIGSNAFDSCDGLTSVHIAEGVLSIGDSAFKSCDALTSINILGSVTSIGDSAFQSCDALTSISIPGNVTSIGSYAFFFCQNLSATYFLGDAPTTFGSSVFTATASSHTIYYFDTSTGFTSPEWNGEPTVMIETSQYPAASWLVTSNIPHDTALAHDHNGDGVPLLMAYALNLNPNDHPASELPQPKLTAGTLEMKFYGSTPGISYLVKASRDLADWETIDVDLSEPDLEGLRTATIPRDDDRGFLKLVVEEQ